MTWCFSGSNRWQSVFTNALLADTNALPSINGVGRRTENDVSAFHHLGVVIQSLWFAVEFTLRIHSVKPLVGAYCLV
jgi:hypothetical protein